MASLLTADALARMRDVASATTEAREQLRREMAAALDAMISSNVLEFVYLPGDDDGEGIAWFSVDASDVDNERELVILYGSPQRILNGPITIEVEDDDADAEGGDDDASADDDEPRHYVHQRSILSGREGGRGGRVFAASVLAYYDGQADRVRTEDEVAEELLSARSRKNGDMVRLVYAAYLLRLEYGQRFPGSRVINAPGVSTLLVSTYPPPKHRFHVADPTCPSFVWHTEGAPIL